MFDRQSRLPLRRTRQQKTNRPTLFERGASSRLYTFALASVYVAFAAISLSTSIPYTQNFNSMGIPLTNPAPSNLPADFRQDTIAPQNTWLILFSATLKLLASVARMFPPPQLTAVTTLAPEQQL